MPFNYNYNNPFGTPEHMVVKGIFNDFLQIFLFALFVSAIVIYIKIQKNKKSESLMKKHKEVANKQFQMEQNEVKNLEGILQLQNRNITSMQQQLSSKKKELRQIEMEILKEKSRLNTKKH